MQLIFSTITFVLIFTTIYSYGLLISNTFYKNYKIDIFFNILIGYTFIGLLTLIFHFFFKINNYFSLILITLGLMIFIYYYSNLQRGKFFELILIIIIFSFILFGYSEHPIDTNMYHHPYVSYLNSDKIVFAIANIQFRFGHISFLQYVQAAFTNDYLHKISLASVNIIFYLSFIYFFSREIFYEKKFSYVFLLKILFVSFILIKFARYREHGNDLIPLLVSIYFFVNILNVNKKHIKDNIMLINLALPFAAFMFLHKISYIFVFLIFLPLLSFIKVKTINIFNLKYLLVFSLMMISWLTKNYVTTSCFAYPVEFTCISNSFYELQGLAKPANAAWLTEIWAKGFIDHPNWNELNLKEYASSFNWVGTWARGHFIKIIEIVSPLFFIILILTCYLFFKKDHYLRDKNTKSLQIFYYFIFFANLAGLLLWFYKAPIFRYGSFYIITFIILTYILFLIFFFEFKKSNKLKFFKSILLISLIFFNFKNILRINESDHSLFPKTTKNEIEYKVIQNNNLKLLKPINDTCYYTQAICSHEAPQNIKIKKLGNYDIYMQ